MQHEFYDLVADARRAGQTVFLSSHVIPEIERTCDRVAILRTGKLVTVERISALKAKAIRHVEIRFARPVPADAFANLPGTRDLTVRDEILRSAVLGSMDQLVKAAARFEVVEINSEEPSLEELFLTYYEPSGFAEPSAARRPAAPQQPAAPQAPPTPQPAAPQPAEIEVDVPPTAAELAAVGAKPAPPAAESAPTTGDSAPPATESASVATDSASRVGESESMTTEPASMESESAPTEMTSAPTETTSATTEMTSAPTASESEPASPATEGDRDVA
jgi:hypothetical protein